MIKKYSLGHPFVTDSVIREIPAEAIEQLPLAYAVEDGKFSFSFKLEKDEILYGLGEAIRGINKRGWLYRSFCSDEPNHPTRPWSRWTARILTFI